MAQPNSISIGLSREQPQGEEEEDQLNSNTPLVGGVGSINEATPRETPMGAVVRHSTRFEKSCTPLSHQHMEEEERQKQQGNKRNDSVDTTSIVMGVGQAERSQTEQGSVYMESQRRRSSCMSIGMMDEHNVDIKAGGRGKSDTNIINAAAGTTTNNTIKKVEAVRKNSQNQTQYVNKNSDTPQRDRQTTHRHSVDVVMPMNRPTSPVDRTLSPVSWRHNPYTLTPTSPTTESVNAGNRMSPCITTHTSLASNSLTVAIKTNAAVRNSPIALRLPAAAPSVTVSAGSNISSSNNNNTSFAERAACIGGGCATSSHDYGRAYASNEAVARGVGGDDDEDEFCGPPSSTLSIYESVSLEQPIHAQSHVQTQQSSSVWPTRHRANSAFCATQSSGFPPSLSASAAASLCSSPSCVSPVSRGCEMRQRSLSLFSTQSSPMMRRSFADSAGPLFTPTTGHGAVLQSPSNVLLDEGGNYMNRYNSNNNNNNNNNNSSSSSHHHHVNSGFGRRCSTESLASPSCFVHSFVPTLTSLPAATGGTTPRSTSGGGVLDNTNAIYNNKNCPRPSSVQREGQSGSLASLTSWSTTPTSSHSGFRRADEHRDTYDWEYYDDEEHDIEAYNATLRPNDVGGVCQENQINAKTTKLRGGHLQGSSNSPSRKKTTMTTHDDMGTNPLRVLHPLARPPLESKPQQQQQEKEEQEQKKANEKAKEKVKQHMSEQKGAIETSQQEQQEQQKQQQQEEQGRMVPVISANDLELMMVNNPKEEVLCPEGFNFSLYDADIRQHYIIESSNIVATRGAVRYVAFQEQYGTHSRFRFQLCKRYINNRCAQKMDCQYIHSHHIPSSTLVHVNENVISGAAIEGRELSAEVLRGGKNTQGYATLPPGVLLHVYPPNQEKSFPQLIPSEMILQTIGASNVHSLLIHFSKKNTIGGGGDETCSSNDSNNSNNTNNNNSNKGGGDPTTADNSNAATNNNNNNNNNNNDTVNTSGIKARHCAHFQFNKMCNLGSSCHFIHSLVPYVQGLSCIPQDPAYTTAMLAQHPALPPNAASHHGVYPAAGAGVPSYPMEMLQQQQQVPPTHTTGVPNPIAAYHPNVHMTQIPVYMQPPVHPQWNAYNYGGNYSPTEYAMSTGAAAIRCLPQQRETLTMMPPPHGQYFAPQF
ncbi:hypothetical protein LSM04_007937 [Trypanosoma melophagium]|uniref:uncharacterized protein n=1 Tax=Trypanosoma melophagium TaxID=715481 RepID=UPI003519E7CE|nr:hypothetical protein LSM04_007937 [Trypanosoma melophagium]